MPRAPPIVSTQPAWPQRPITLIVSQSAGASPDVFARLISDHEGRGADKLAPGTRALHIDFVDGVGHSKLTGPFIEKRLGCKGTARNVRSIKRIIEKLG